MAKRRFLGSRAAHHVLPLPRVHGHDQQPRNAFIYELQRMEPTPYKKKKIIPPRAFSFGFFFLQEHPPPFTPSLLLLILLF